MPLGTCPQCNAIFSFGRFLRPSFSDPAGVYRCVQCKSALRRNSGFLSFVIDGVLCGVTFLVVYWWGRGFEIPIPTWAAAVIVSVALVVLILLFQIVHYLFDDWRVQDAASDARAKRPALWIVSIVWLAAIWFSYSAIREIFFVHSDDAQYAGILALLMLFLAVSITRKRVKRSGVSPSRR